MYSSGLLNTAVVAAFSSIDEVARPSTRRGYLLVMHNLMLVLMVHMVVVWIVVFDMLQRARKIIAPAHCVHLAIVRGGVEHIGEVLLIGELLLLVLHELLRDRHLGQVSGGWNSNSSSALATRHTVVVPDRARRLVQRIQVKHVPIRTIKLRGCHWTV